MGGYVVYRKRSGLSLRHSVSVVHQRPPDFHELGYRTALVPIFGADVSAQTLVSAAKLIGKDGHRLRGLRAAGTGPAVNSTRACRKRRRLGARSSRAPESRAAAPASKVRTGLIRARNPGAALADEAQRIGADVIYLSTLHAPAS